MTECRAQLWRHETVVEGLIVVGISKEASVCCFEREARSGPLLYEAGMVLGVLCTGEGCKERDGSSEEVNSHRLHVL